MDKRWLVGVLLLLFVTVLIRTAWVGDDAYITLRTVDNFTRGYGLRWNVAERVQAYTHPLWMLLLIPFYAITRDAYFTALGLNIALSVTALGLLLTRGARTWANALLIGSAMVLSKAFTDYSTSGLENPLLHFCLVIFAIWFFSEWKDTRALLWLTLCFAFALLTRLDLAPLLAPPYVWRVWQTWRAQAHSFRELCGVVLVGMLPLITWEVFSLVYYGFPFPNTAYAKLSTGIPRADLIRQGFCYLMDSIRVDPVTLLMIGLAIGWGVQGRSTERAAAVGIVLSLVYVVNVGGDFMTGRFLTPALVWAAALLAQAPISGPTASVVTAVFAITGVLMPKCPLRSDENYQDRHFWNYNGIADERGMFYQQSGLLRFSREVGELPMDPHVEAGRKVRFEAEASTNVLVMVHPDGTVGYFGYEAGPKVHIVDPFALADPLLARMIAEGHVVRHWRIGHFTRSIPPGYVETLRTGQNVIEDPDYAKYYDKLALITRGPLWSIERFKAIVNMNLGRYNRWLSGKVIFGAHSFKHRIGERILDQRALSEGTLAAREERDAEGYLAFGNYMVLKRGTYAARFRLRAIRRSTEPMVRLDVAGDRGQTVLAERILSAEDWPCDMEWAEFQLPFNITKKRMKNVEFRVYYLGRGDVALDSVTLAW